MHCASSKWTGPSPCNCNDSVPSNLIVAASNNEAATASPKTSRMPLRVLPMLDQGPPRGIEMHQMPAYWKLLEHEAVQTVAVMHLHPARQLGFQQFIELRRVRLAPGRFHHLADEETE